MNLETYQESTGLTVPDAQRGVVSAQIERSQGILESALGFTLDPDLVTKNLYTEAGKTTSDWAWPGSFDNLLPADPVVGAYRLYNYDRRDLLIHVDPYSALHAMKLVVGGVTVHTFDPQYFSTYSGRGGVRKYIAVAPIWWSFYVDWIAQIHGDVQLAVDADWLWPETESGQELPSDLQYAWVDIIRYYSDPTRLLKSENRGTRSYTKVDVKPPHEEDATKSILARYAGPHGTAGRLPV